MGRAGSVVRYQTWGLQRGFGMVSQSRLQLRGAAEMVLMLALTGSLALRRRSRFCVDHAPVMRGCV